MNQLQLAYRKLRGPELYRAGSLWSGVSYDGASGGGDGDGGEGEVGGVESRGVCVAIQYLCR